MVPEIQNKNWRRETHIPINNSEGGLLYKSVQHSHNHILVQSQVHAVLQLWQYSLYQLKCYVKGLQTVKKYNTLVQIV